MLVLVLGTVVVLAGATASVVLVLRRATSADAVLEADPLRPRLVAEVATGGEQLLIAIARGLGLPHGPTDVGYGEVYLADSAGLVLRLASRSELGRGFDGEVRVQRGHRSSSAEFLILRLPVDEEVAARVHELEDRIEAAVRGIDPGATIRRRGR